MVSKSSAIIKYRSLKSNLLHLPLTLYAQSVQSQLRPQSIVVHLKHLSPGKNGSRGSRTGEGSLVAPEASLGWSGLVAAGSLENYGLAGGRGGMEMVEIDPGVCLELGWMEGDIVEINIITSPSKARSLSVTPLTSDDWEILELHANYLEANLLSQLRAGISGQIISVWVLGKHKIRVKIDETNPPTTPQSSALLLTIDTEIFVAPRPRQTKSNGSAQFLASSSSYSEIQKNGKGGNEAPVNGPEGNPLITSSLKQATTSGKSNGMLSTSTNGGINHDATLIKAASPRPVLRAIPKRIWTSWTHVKNGVGRAGLDNETTSAGSKSMGTGESVGYVSPRTLERIGGTRVSEKGIWATVERLGEEKVDVKEEGAQEEGKETTKFSGPPMVMLKAVRGIPNGHVVFWPDLDCSKDGQSGEHMGKEKDWTRYSVGLSSPPEAKKMKDSSAKQTRHPIPPPSTSRNPTIPLAGVDDIISNIVSYYQRGKVLHSSSSTSTNKMIAPLLLQGPSGSGKTAIAMMVGAYFERSKDTLTSLNYIDCKTDQGNGSLTSSREIIKSWFVQAKSCAPCLTILDNLESLITPEAEHTDNTTSVAIAEYFASCMAGTEAGVPVVRDGLFLATAKDLGDLNGVMKVRRVFGKFVEVGAPSQEVRKAILTTTVEAKLLSLGAEAPLGNSLNYTLISNITEGYSASDLQDLVDNALKGWLIRQASSSTGDLLDLRDFEKAAVECKPRSLRDIKLQTSNVEWADVGGLRETKAVLRETLEWPTKYGAIFRNCPLRLRSGLLLYGYSGCGKTLLASAVAKECGLHFISVKGPELLNKYIGASEKSVRDIFARAKAAKPCVLFFDEFESIAPKRGHDSTGVTDRVVNQLLTEMDGAEGLEGVYVLAATSRPDLIDSALLRPGRLDKSLLCGMPDHQDRLEILMAVSRKVVVDPSIDWEELATDTEGYTGADLQALLSNAQLSCVHETIDEEKAGDRVGRINSTSQGQADIRKLDVLRAGKSGSTLLSHAERVALSREMDVVLEAYGLLDKITSDEPNSAEAPRSQPIVRGRHLQGALHESKPSLPEAEKRKLDRVYAQFVSSRSAIPQAPTSNGVGQRATLA